ncbi:MAG: hypothetical protein J5772_03335 [Clostridia bacterium]|nr:hypothetical protein [Clostridia bacterium]
MKAHTAVLSIAHAAVDLACAALFFGFLHSGDVWLNMVLYNAFAFLMQLPMGVIADRLNRNLLFAGIGCGLVALAYPLAGVPALSAVVAGIGNGAFHVGGGIEVLNRSRTKAGALGVFVSPGAVGLFLGRFYSAEFRSLPYLLPALLALIGLLIAFLPTEKRRFVTGNAEFDASVERGGILPLAALFLVVVLRSFLGTTDAFSPGSALSALPPLAAGLIPVLCLAFGKAAGGFVSDAIGIRLTSVLSLGLCALALFFPFSPWVTLGALFLFNMTMPITLYASAKLLKGAKGTAFGLLTAALFIGCVPVFMGAPLGLHPAVSGGLALVSLALLLIGLKKEKA